MPGLSVSEKNHWKERLSKRIDKLTDEELNQLKPNDDQILANGPTVESIQEQPLTIQYAWRETASGPEIRFQAHHNLARLADPWRCTDIVPDFLVCLTSGVTRLIARTVRSGGDAR